MRSQHSGAWEASAPRVVYGTWEASVVGRLRWVILAVFGEVPVAQSRLIMRQIRDLRHLHYEQGRSQRLMARSLGVARSTVAWMLERFMMSGLTWPPDPALTNPQPKPINPAGSPWPAQVPQLDPKISPLLGGEVQ